MGENDLHRDHRSIIASHPTETAGQATGNERIGAGRAVPNAKLSDREGSTAAVWRGSGEGQVLALNGSDRRQQTDLLLRKSCRHLVTPSVPRLSQGDVAGTPRTRSASPAEILTPKSTRDRRVMRQMLAVDKGRKIFRSVKRFTLPSFGGEFQFTTAASRRGRTQIGRRQRGRCELAPQPPQATVPVGVSRQHDHAEVLRDRQRFEGPRDERSSISASCSLRSQHSATILAIHDRTSAADRDVLRTRWLDHARGHPRPQRLAPRNRLLPSARWAIRRHCSRESWPKDMADSAHPCDNQF
jgi:hypothetical protein